MSRSDGTNPTASGVPEDSNEPRASPDLDPGTSSEPTTGPQQNLQRTRELLEGLASTAFRRAERAIERRVGTPTSAGTATTSSSSPLSSNGGTAEHRSRRRRRRRSRDSSSENDESVARRRRRASNVVESLRELLLVPTSSTLGESTTTDGTTPRSDPGVGSGGTENGLPPLQFSIANMLRDRNNDRESENENENENANENANENDSEESEDESDEIVDTTSIDNFGLDIDGLIDRDRILNNLTQRSMGILRDIEGSGTPGTTDLKCPVCNEVFVDYETSNHPNAAGRRSGNARCSHGAMSLFTKLNHCPICFEEDIEPPNVVALACGHVVCKGDFCKLGGHVGPDRPAGQPKPKMVPPGRTTTRESSSSSPGSINANNINSRSVSLANRLSTGGGFLPNSLYSRWLSETAGSGIGLPFRVTGTTSATPTDRTSSAGAEPPPDPP